MIKFFRRIRQKLLSQNRFSKYLIYAVGEILLVMAGILLALQVNNWNENRKTNQLEQTYLRALKQEFNGNLKNLKNTIDLNKKNAENALMLTTYTGPNAHSITEKEFATLLFGATNTEVQYRPGSGVLKEIVSSGKLGIFKNQKLKNALASWDGIMLSTRFQEQEHAIYRSRINELLEGPDINTRSMVFDLFGELYGIKNGKFKSENARILQSQSFENLLVAFIMTAGYLDENYYGNLEKEINEVLSLINTELEDN